VASLLEDGIDEPYALADTLDDVKVKADYTAT
jgi:hypothetical protein